MFKVYLAHGVNAVCAVDEKRLWTINQSDVKCEANTVKSCPTYRAIYSLGIEQMLQLYRAVK